MKRPHYREGAPGSEPFGVATATQHNHAQRDRTFPSAESPNRSGQDSDMGLYRGSLYEPPYSIWQATVGFIVIAVSGLLYLWLWRD